MIKWNYSIIKIVIILFICFVSVNTFYAHTATEPLDIKRDRVQAGIKMVDGEYVAVISAQLNDRGESIVDLSDMKIKREGNVFSVYLRK